MYRQGNSLICHDGRIYIYGGHSFKGLTNNMNMHYYDLKMQTWKKINHNEG
jgi:hypothetical protein